MPCSRLRGRRSPIALRPDFRDERAPVSRPQVYATLAACLAVAALGVYVNATTGFGGLLAVLGFVGLTTWLTALPALPSNLSKRQALLGGVAFCQGATVGPLVNHVLHVNPQ